MKIADDSHYLAAQMRDRTREIAQSPSLELGVENIRVGEKGTAGEDSRAGEEGTAGGNSRAPEEGTTVGNSREQLTHPQQAEAVVIITRTEQPWTGLTPTSRRHVGETAAAAPGNQLIRTSLVAGTAAPPSAGIFTENTEGPTDQQPEHIFTRLNKTENLQGNRTADPHDSDMFSNVSLTVNSAEVAIENSREEHSQPLPPVSDTTPPPPPPPLQSSPVSSPFSVDSTAIPLQHYPAVGSHPPQPSPATTILDGDVESQA